MLDNLLGLMFGALRGALIVSLSYAMIMFAIAGKEPPDWLKDAKSRPFAEKGADILAKSSPDFLKEISTLEKKATDNMQAVKENSAEESENGSGYSKTAGHQLDRLIDSTSH